MRTISVMTLDAEGTVTFECYTPPESWEVPADWHREGLEGFMPSMPTDLDGMADQLGAVIEGAGGIIFEEAEA